MPYQRIADLPKPVRDNYTPNQLQTFLSTFNSALAQYDSEERAFSVAHAAAQRMEEKAMRLKWMGNHFIAAYTNPYQDRDHEWFAEKAIDEDIRRMQTTGEYPPLWFYHIPNLAIGQVDNVQKMGRFAVALGHVFTDPLSQALKAHIQSHDYRLSHGFTYDPLNYRHNTYHNYQTFEISALPADRASNPFTAFLSIAKGVISNE